MANRGIPSIAELPSEIFTKEKVAIKYLIDNNALVVPVQCAHENCGGHMNRKSKNHREYQCSRCKKVKSITSGTFFDHLRKIHIVLYVCHLWIAGAEQRTMVALSKKDKKQVAALRGFLQQVCMIDLESLPDEGIKLGLPDPVTGVRSIVEVDESKLGVRKYNRGHRVNGVWVVGLIERCNYKRFVVVAVEDRSAPTLEAIIAKFVDPGATIYSDMWKGYRTWALHQMGYLHGTVNHSLFFKDPATGIHTNTIEGIWSWVKRACPPSFRTAERVDGFLWEFMWKRKFDGVLWARLLECFRNIRYDGEPVHQPAPVAQDALGIPMEPLPLDFMDPDFDEADNGGWEDMLGDNCIVC